MTRADKPAAAPARAMLCLALALASGAPPLAAQEPPPALTAPVNDFAGVVDGASEAELDALIRRLHAASGDVIVVATVKTFAPAGDIRMYANEMFENQGKGIGEKGKDNGLLVVLAVDDREVWTEVGYDLEGIITDGFAGETARQRMAPRFKQGDFGGGLLAGVSAYAERIARARNVRLDNVPVRDTPREENGGFPIFPIVMFLFIAMHVLRAIIPGGRRRRYGRRRWGSMVGPFGAGYGGWHRGGGGWSGGGGFGGGFGGFGGGRSGGGGGGASW